jgi:hypothetical protein
LLLFDWYCLFIWKLIYFNCFFFFCFLGNLEKFVNLQMNAMDSLNTNINLVQARLDMSKEQHAMDQLSKMRTPIAATVGLPTRKLTGGDAPANTTAKEPYARQPLSKRLNKYEDVGVAFSGMREENVRRTSAYKK